MTTDALLAVAHHSTVFGLLAVLAAEWGIVRPGLTKQDVERLRRFDLAYGVLAGLVLVAGMTRVVLGAKPQEFDFENPTSGSRWSRSRAVVCYRSGRRSDICSGAGISRATAARGHPMATSSRCAGRSSPNSFSSRFSLPSPR